MKSFGRVLRFVLGRVMLLLCSPRGAWPAVEEAAERAVSEASAEGSTAAAAPLGSGDAPGSGVEGACLSVVPAEGIAQPARKIPRLSLDFLLQAPSAKSGEGKADSEGSASGRQGQQPCADSGAAPGQQGEASQGGTVPQDISVGERIASFFLPLTLVGPLFTRSRVRRPDFVICVPGDF